MGVYGTGVLLGDAGADKAPGRRANGREEEKVMRWVGEATHATICKNGRQSSVWAAREEKMSSMTFESSDSPEYRGE